MSIYLVARVLTDTPCHTSSCGFVQGGPDTGDIQRAQAPIGQRDSPFAHVDRSA